MGDVKKTYRLQKSVTDSFELLYMVAESSKIFEKPLSSIKIEFSRKMKGEDRADKPKTSDAVASVSIALPTISLGIMKKKKNIC